MATYKCCTFSSNWDRASPWHFHSETVPYFLNCRVNLHVVVLAGSYQVPEGTCKCFCFAAMHFVSIQSSTSFACYLHTAICHHSCFYQAGGWYQKTISKSCIILYNIMLRHNPKELRHWFHHGESFIKHGYWWLFKPRKWEGIPIQIHL